MRPLSAPGPGGLATAQAACTACGRPHPLTARTGACGCGRAQPLAVRAPGDAAALRAGLAGNVPSLWRYEALLPVSRRFASPLQVGWTPLVACGRVGGVELLVKDETRNPSGSLKDRASEVVVAVARAHGIGEAIVASTGNAAASLACIGAATGLRVTVLVPEATPVAKLAQALAYGATVHRVAGSYDDAVAMAGRIAAARGLLDRTTGLNPFTREGKKTCAFEICEQMGWRAPDWVIVPTGDGNILSALWKGFGELARHGVVTACPRLVAAQALGSCAIARAHDPGAVPADAPRGTIADSIAVDAPRDEAAALAALARTRGVAVTVDDGAIAGAVRALASRFGLFVEPSSAAAYAAFEALRGAGRFGPGERVVCLATGSGLKDVGPLLAALPAAAAPVRPEEWRALAAPPPAARRAV
ncbi:Threonine synthase [Methylobacterium crusticola]|uniref:Threonine synthase n=1 Tax=Methylobacterium crusticola TaxID=1697972 RepID=A0ABQ4R3G0_9HYPH|nr:threonine synthase [Methylobacterium crusticola]GJD51394.1 Threonine synthase [Methylobacterium crusticola]